MYERNNKLLQNSEQLHTTSNSKTIILGFDSQLEKIKKFYQSVSECNFMKYENY